MVEFGRAAENTSKARHADFIGIEWVIIWKKATGDFNENHHKELRPS